MEAMVELITTKLFSIILGSFGLILALCLFFKVPTSLKIKLLGSLFVMAISFSTTSATVHVIAVFVIATLVTELEFLEKLAALIWSRKEYWDYRIELANKAEVKEKQDREAAEDLSDLNEADDVEAANDDIEAAPEGLLKTNVDTNQSTISHLQSEFQFLNTFRKHLKNKQVKLEVRLSSNLESGIVDALIEGDGIHYLVEAKRISTLSALVSARRQLDKYSRIYENYLKERKKKITVQSVILIPKTEGIENEFRGVPVIQFDEKDGTFTNLNIFEQRVPEMTVPQDELEPREVLVKFLKTYSNWAFSPLRIQKWGATQSGFSKLGKFSIKELRSELEQLVIKNIVERRRSKKGNTLYIWKK